MRTTFPVILILMLPLLTACGVTERRQFATDRDPDQIWAAMKAVAQTPDYYMQNPDVGERWMVRENDVAFDDDAWRIEVYRRLEREIHEPLSPVRHEERTWKFEILLEAGKPPAEPVMVFRTRNAGVPAHAWNEAGMYFDEVENFLRPNATTAPVAPSVTTKPAPTSAPATHP